MALINNIGIILIVLIAVVSAILIIVIIVEKKLRKRVVQNQGSRNLFYIRQVDDINKTNARSGLTQIDKITMTFLEEAFMIKQSADYSALEKFFRQRGNKELANFCRVMNNALYSGIKANNQENERISLMLKEIIKNNPLYTEEELERMKEEKSGMFGNTSKGN